MSIEKRAKTLEWFFQYVQNHSNPTVEDAIEKLGKLGAIESRDILIKVWEKQNAPYRWNQEESLVYGVEDK